MLATRKKEVVFREMVEETTEGGQREELLANIRRLSRIVMDRLEEGSKEGTLDQAQIRLLGSIAMKSLGLWQEALNPRPRRGLRREARETEERLPKETVDKGAKG
jgi:hypothetical protein